MAVVDHGDAQILLIDRQVEADGVNLVIIVSVVDAVQDQFLNHDQEKAQSLGAWSMRLQPSFRFGARGCKRIALAPHIDCQPFAHWNVHPDWNWQGL